MKTALIIICIIALIFSLVFTLEGYDSWANYKADNSASDIGNDILGQSDSIASGFGDTIESFQSVLDFFTTDFVDFFTVDIPGYFTGLSDNFIAGLNYNVEVLRHVFVDGFGNMGQSIYAAFSGEYESFEDFWADLWSGFSDEYGDSSEGYGGPGYDGGGSGSFGGSGGGRH